MCTVSGPLVAEERPTTLRPRSCSYTPRLASPRLRPPPTPASKAQGSTAPAQEPPAQVRRRRVAVSLCGYRCGCIPVQTAIKADGPTQHKVARLHSVPPLTARVFFVPQEAAGRSTETSMPTGSTRPRCTLTVDTFYRGYRRQAQETTQLGRQKGLGGGQPLLATGPCSWGRAACVHVRRKHERPVKT